MKPWLRNAVVAVVVSIAAVSIGWVSACTFYIGPRLWAEYVRSGGLRPAQEPAVCQDADSRALQVLTGLLATLISLGSRLEGGD